MDLFSFLFCRELLVLKLYQRLFQYRLIKLKSSEISFGKISGLSLEKTSGKFDYANSIRNLKFLSFL